MTTGPKPPLTDLFNGYVQKALLACQHDVRVAKVFWDIGNLQAAPLSLMAPATALRVLVAARKGPAGVTQELDVRADEGAMERGT